MKNCKDYLFEFRYNEIHKTTNYVSSCSYIKFLSTFHTLYENKIEEISSKKNRYKQGLEKLNFTADQVRWFFFSFTFILLITSIFLLIIPHFHVFIFKYDRIKVIIFNTFRSFKCKMNSKS